MKHNINVNNVIISCRNVPNKKGRYDTRNALTLKVRGTAVNLYNGPGIKKRTGIEDIEVKEIKRN